MEARPETSEWTLASVYCGCKVGRTISRPYICSWRAGVQHCVEETAPARRASCDDVTTMSIEVVVVVV